MEYLSPPTTPKKQRLFGSPSRTASNGVAAMTLSPDRYIPNRSHVDFDYCNSMLSPGSGNENGDTEGGAAKDKNAQAMDRYISSAMMGGGGSGGKRMIEVFECPAEHDPVTEQSLKPPADSSTVLATGRKKTTRVIPTTPLKILDAPNLVDDYYLNLLSWSSTNVVAVALKGTVYLWHAEDSRTVELLKLPDTGDIVTSVQWSPRDGKLAVGTSSSEVQIWDAETETKLQSIVGHTARVSALSWNGNHVLSSGGRDSCILNHDTRQRVPLSDRSRCLYAGHQQEVCGLEWSPDGTTLASGGNDNMLCLWDAAMSGGRGSLGGGVDRSGRGGLLSGVHEPRNIFRDHVAAVKALAWCPFQRNVLASGGGTADRRIRIWNTNSGTMLHNVETGSQVCALQWSETHKELVSSHGFSDNQLCLWEYPTMNKLREFRGHTARVLHMAKSPDGTTILSGSADETLRFWNIFRANSSRVSTGGRLSTASSGGRRSSTGSYSSNLPDCTDGLFGGSCSPVGVTGRGSPGGLYSGMSIR